MLLRVHFGQGVFQDMIKGLLLGGASALALAALFVASVSLLVPPPSLVSDRPVAVRPEAPVLRDQSEVAVRVPEPPVDTVPIIPAEIKVSREPRRRLRRSRPPSGLRSICQRAASSTVRPKTAMRSRRRRISQRVLSFLRPGPTPARFGSTHRTCEPKVPHSRNRQRSLVCPPRPKPGMRRIYRMFRSKTRRRRSGRWRSSNP